MFHQLDRSCAARQEIISLKAVVKPKSYLLLKGLSLMLALFFVTLIFIELSGATQHAQAHPLSSGTVNTCDETNFKNALAGGGTVTFSCSGIITLTSSALITSSTTINGAGQNVTINGNNVVRIITSTTGVGTLTMLNITLTNGIAVTGTGSHGGALFVRGALVLSNTTIIGNSATGDGGGAYVTGTLTLTNAQFISNTAGRWGGGVYVSGAATLNGGLFQTNSALYGGGAQAAGNLTLTNTEFMGNTAVRHGGGLWVGSTATLNGGKFQNNRADRAGGLNANSTLNLTGTQFLGNIAYIYGGGIYHAHGTGRVVNALFARNVVIDTRGAALFLDSTGSVEILHTTIASPTLGSGEAIHVAEGTIGITNTLISNYSIGISRTYGTVYENYNLFFGTPISKTGLFVAGSGANDVTGNPKFVLPAGDNYHLRVGSAAIDAGANAGVTTDFDGHTRPSGPGFEIGYDEFRYTVYLPLALKNF